MVSTSRTAGVRRSSTRLSSSSVRSTRSTPLDSAKRTHSPDASCASRKGTPSRTIHSARSVAKVKPCGASSRMRSVWNSNVETRPVIAGSSKFSCATESTIGSLSSCKSRLYAKGCALSVARSPARLPIRRPVLPRVSSATSGFFFCGMIEEPVDQASLKVT